MLCFTKILSRDNSVLSLFILYVHSFFSVFLAIMLPKVPMQPLADGLVDADFLLVLRFGESH